MMKKYNSLFIAVALLLVAGLNASEKPFFDEPTKNVVKKAAKFYAGSSLALYGAGKTLQTISGAPLFAKDTFVDLHVLYNDTFPKDYYPQSVTKKIAAQGARGCLMAGSVYSAPLRSVVSTVIAPIEWSIAGIAVKKYFESNAAPKAVVTAAVKATVKECAKDMVHASCYGIFGFGLPVAYHKYQQSKRA